MKRYFTKLILLLVLAMALIVSCSDEVIQTKTTVVARPTVPIQNSEVRIGQLKWSTKNLDVIHYRNGDIIPQVTDLTQWANLTTGAWCYYENSTANGAVYNKLYNWYAVNDPRGLAPRGWHIPSLDEWKASITYLGGELAAGGSLKSTSLWQSPNVGATNSSSFSALPGGFRNGGYFFSLLEMAVFWTTTPSTIGQNNRWTVSLNNSSTIARSFQYNGMATGCSIRCVKDNDVTDIDGNTYKGISIGTQIWTQSNLNVSRYRNGDIIPQVTNHIQWENLTTGAWCYYANSTANGVVYGKLYNWYAVNDPRGLAPQGWHVPSDAEWSTLTTYLGEDSAGGKMKSVTLWGSFNTGATNSSGFSGFPGGYRSQNSTSFYDVGLEGYWWSSSELNTTISWCRGLSYLSATADRSLFSKTNGMSVRCIRD